MQYGIVIYASLAKDDPIEFLQTAQLAVKLKSLGVCGFGVLGTRTTASLLFLKYRRQPPYSLSCAGDLKASEYEFFRGTFDFLKRNNVNVNISAGRTEYPTLLIARIPFQLIIPTSFQPFKCC